MLKKRRNYTPALYLEKEITAIARYFGVQYIANKLVITNLKMRSLHFLGWSISAFLLVHPQPIAAETLTTLQPSNAPLELSLLAPDAPINNQTVVTANTISQDDLTVPSLWWAKQQFASKLLDNWIAYPSDGITPGRIDLIVNRQMWSLLDYLQRYEFVHHFGTVARDYRYNIRVFNYQQELLATYTCDFSTSSLGCQIANLSTTGTGMRRPNEDQNGV